MATKVKLNGLSPRDVERELAGHPKGFKDLALQALAEFKKVFIIYSEFTDPGTDYSALEVDDEIVQTNEGY